MSHSRQYFFLLLRLSLGLYYETFYCGIYLCSIIRLPALPANIRLGWKWMANTLTCYVTKLNKAVKEFNFIHKLFLRSSFRIDQGLYSQFFIFFLTYECVQWVRVWHYSMLEGLECEKYPSLLGPFVGRRKWRVVNTATEPFKSAFCC
jgi:hypothetical protein